MSREEELLARLRTVEAERNEWKQECERRNVFNNEVAAACDAAEARVEALQPFLKHRHGCAALATAGGMFAPGPCTCGLAALAVSGNQP